MPKILAIDTSATPVSCAIVQDERLLASVYAHTASTHSQTLMPMIEHALKITNITIKDIDALAVNSGPGSFTGVRIGVSTVKGLAFAGEKPCVEVSTLESMAECMRGLPINATICCVMDARCRQVYTALFSLNCNGDIERITPDEAISIDDLQTNLQKISKPIFLVGDGAQICYDALKEFISSLHLSPLALRYQSAAGVAEVALRKLQDGHTVSSNNLMPRYLRLPQAERELRSRQGKE